MRSNTFFNFRILILSASEDAETILRVFQNEEVHPFICQDLKQLCTEIEAGADAAFLAEDFILSDTEDLLEKTLQRQPIWSDFPLIVLTFADMELKTAENLQAVGNMTFIGRPLRPHILLTTIRSALRDRKRQYNRRDYLIERERDAATLAETEERTRSILDAALDAVVMMNSDGLVTEWNKRAEALFGWTREEAIGQSMSEMIIPHAYRAMHKKGMERYLNTGEAHILNQRVEITALNKAGEIFPVELTVTAQRLNGKIYFTSFTRDITERLATEQIARESREHLELMVESARDFAIISMNPDGNIISWNTGATKIFGYAADEIIGKHVDIIFTSDDRAINAPEKELETAALTGRANDERWHERKNGERFYASGIMAAMYDADRNVKGFIKIARDRTEEKNTEEKLIEARNAAEAANIAKTEFLANMSHEIRTPMNAVIGLANLLGSTKPLTRQQKEFISTLQTSADSLLALINDLLDIAKIEGSNVDLERIPFSLSRLIQEVISMMAAHVREKSLTFTCNDECIENRMFIGDPTRLRQIIMNLCSNAVKFTESGGININIVCHPADTQNMENVHIKIEDTGIGIAPDKLDTIFEKFVQADNSINRKYGGTGLGLAITKTLTEVMGGTITVKSEVNKGSVFEVRIPLEIATDADAREAEGSLTSITNNAIKVKMGPLVLLVEDYQPNIIVACGFLEQFGYRVDVAINGLEAIDKIKTRTYVLALMDVQMHGMNGLDATRLIREHERQNNLSRLPIVGMTAHAMAGDRERCLAVGMDDYIAKPYDPELLKSKIETLKRSSHLA